MAKTAEPPKQDGGPLAPPRIVRALAAGAIVVMVLTVAVDAVFGHVGHFGLDGIVGAYAVIGLVSGFVIIGIAKGLGVPLSRPDAYYGESDREAGK